MKMTLAPGEPAASHWRVLSTAQLAELVTATAGQSSAPPLARPRIIAVDGRGAAGKSTLTDALARVLPQVAIVHTDDIAWHEPFFGWSSLLVELLTAVHSGRGATLRPPAWRSHGRAGQLAVPAETATLLVEGTGASPRECAELIDLTIWVQSDFDLAERRGIERDIAHARNGDPDQTAAFWHEWMNHELAYFAEQQPWQRAGLVVAGTPVLDLPLPTGHWAVAEGSDLN